LEGETMIKLFLSSKEDLIDCCMALEDSKLFDEYFYDIEKRKSFISEGIEKQEVYIAKDENKKTVGFIQIGEKGMFSKYPFLRLIAVKQEYRNKGYGTELLNFYEAKYKNKVDRVFLSVSSFNDSAKKFYKSLGFFEVGRIDGLYKKSVTEYIIMKLI
jgi:ribosomal protein S18 acetylase RimI-like enzyme